MKGLGWYKNLQETYGTGGANTIKGTMLKNILKQENLKEKRGQHNMKILRSLTKTDNQLIGKDL